MLDLGLDLGYDPDLDRDLDLDLGRDPNLGVPHGTSDTHRAPLTQLFPTLNTQPHTSCPGVPQIGYDYTGAW